MVDDREQARAIDPLDAHFADNMVRIREEAGVSQAEMVSELRLHGWTNVHPTTISRIEKRERPVKLSEAAHIAAVLQIDLGLMLNPAEEAATAQQLDRAFMRFVRAHDEIGWRIYQYPKVRDALFEAIRNAERVADETNNEDLKRMAEHASNYVYAWFDSAVTAGQKAIEDKKMDGRRSNYLEAYGLLGYISPTPDELRNDDAET